MKFKLFLLFAAFLLSIPVFGQSNELFNRFRLAQSYEQTGNLEKAKAIFEEIYQTEPNNFQFFEALHRVYVRSKEFDKAISIAEKRYQINKEDVNLAGILGSTYYQKGDENKAYEVWDNALKVNPNSSVNYRVIGTYAAENRAYEKAIEIYKKGKENSDNKQSFIIDIAYLNSILMRYDEAIKEYLSILDEQPNQVAVVKSRMTNFINRDGIFEKAVNQIEEKFKKNKNENYYDLMAWLYIENQNFEKAFEMHSKLDEFRGNNGSEIYNFALRAYNNRAFEAASNAYKFIIEKYPNSPFAVNSKLGFARTNEAVLNNRNFNSDEIWKPFYKINPAKEFNEVISSYEEVIKLYKKSAVTDEAYFRIGTIQFERLNDLDAAKNTFENLIEISPVGTFVVQANLKLAEIEMQKGNLNEAENFYKKVIEISRSTPAEKNAANFSLAKIEFYKGNFDFSSKMLNSIIDAFTDNIANDAIELSLIINTNKKDSVSLDKFAKAEFLTEQKKFAEAAGIYSETAKNENLLTLRDLAELRIAEMYVAENELLKASELLSQIITEEKSNIHKDKAYFLLGDIYNYGLKDNNEAIKYYEKLLAIFPNSLYLDAARENINVLKNKMSDKL